MLQRYLPGKFLLSQRPGSASKEGKRATRCFTWYRLLTLEGEARLTVAGKSNSIWTRFAD